MFTVPLLKGTVGLLLERISTTIQIIFVAPRVIDSDFEGEIKVLTRSPKRISVVKMGQRPAHLILLPQVQTNKQTKNQVERDKRGESVFGSADGYWLQAIGPQRPELTLFPSRELFWPAR